MKSSESIIEIDDNSNEETNHNDAELESSLKDTQLSIPPMNDSQKARKKLFFNATNEECSISNDYSNLIVSIYIRDAIS